MKNNGPQESDDKRTLDELIIINNLINKICSIRETNHIMDAIISELIEHTKSDQGVINLVSPREEGDLATVVRVQDHGLNTVPYKVGDSISGWVLKNKKLLKIVDLDNDERFLKLDSDNGSYKSILCFPLIARSEIIGLTTLIRSDKKEPFDDNDCHLVGILTSQTAQVLANAKLMEELARSNAMLEMSRQKLKTENQKLRKEVKARFSFENIIGKSPAIKKVLSLTSKYCDIDSPVLIYGETGTGKELIARAIHDNSGRKSKPLVVFNCGIKTETLLESELFGHVRGAFTGAIRDKNGLFKEANGGTIFLDEIGDASLSTQLALLRVIQNGEIKPLGSTKTEIVDVRVISATNKDLKKESSEKNFREDLYYRLATFVIELPPLRERKKDIPLLINYVLEKLKIKINRDTLSISPEALDILMKYSWPGNIRQLENEIERAAVVCGSNGIIDPKDLSPDLFAQTGDYSKSDGYRGRLRDIVEKVESDIIKATLAECKGNVLQTSKLLGLTRKGLKNKMARYNIELDFKRLIS